MTSPDLLPDTTGALPGALCPQTDPEIFFPERGGSPAAAKKVCAACEVRGDCLALALSLGNVQGVWGGMTERERSKLKRSRRIPAPARHTCPGCAQEFTRPTPHAIYCGDLCRQAARRQTKAASQARREGRAA